MTAASSMHSMRVLSDQAELYRHCAQLIRAEYPGAAATLDLATLHGADGRREGEEDSVSEGLKNALNEFDDAIRCRICAEESPWAMRTVTNIVTAARLDQFLARLDTFAGRRHQARAFVSRTPLSALAPLIIAKHVVVLGADDDRFHRAGSAIEFTDPAAVRWACDYYERLWNGATYKIRDGAGINAEEVRRLREHVHLGEQYEDVIKEMNGRQSKVERALRTLVAVRLEKVAVRRGRTAAMLVAEAMPSTGPSVFVRPPVLPDSAGILLGSFTWRGLLDLIRRHWSAFEDVFGDRDDLWRYGDIVLNDRRSFHAGDIDAADFALHRKAIRWFSDRIERAADLGAPEKG